MKRFSIAFILLYALLIFIDAQAQQQQVVHLDVPNSIILPDEFRKDSPADITGQWSLAAPMPAGKTYHTIGSADGVMYVFAGLNASSQWDVTSLMYDPALDTWSPIASFPLPKFLFGRSETVNGKIYIFGGVENFGNNYKAINAMIEYDPASDSYTQKTPMPITQTYPGSAVLNGKIYLFGGNGSSESVYQTTVQVYDPATDTWFRDTDYPRNVKWVGATTVGSRIVSTGGFNVTYNPSRYIADTYVGEIVGGSLQWTKKADAGIGPVIFPISGSVGGKAYFVGGRPSADQNAPSTQRGFVYDIDADTWTELPIKPTGVQYYSQAAVLSDKLYYAGGSTASGAITASVEFYDPSAESQPNVVLSDDSLNVWVKRTNTYQYAFALRNIGGAPLDWSSSVTGADWLTVDIPNAGTIQSGQQSVVIFTINPNALSEGQYTGEIKIASNDPDHPELIFTVSITVQEADVDEDLNVLVEQYTGTWCQWCPYGADSLAAVATRNGTRMVRTSWHDSDPMEIAEWNAMNSWIGVTAFPTASINRVQWPGETEVPIDRIIWGNRTEYLIRNQRAPVGIEISEKSYDPNSKTYSFKAKVFFHQGMNADLRLNAVVTEDDFNYPQKRINTSTGVIETLNPYSHKAVVRGIWPDIRGYKLSLANSFASQSEIEQVFTFTSPHINADNAHLNVYVHTINPGDRPGVVHQAVTEPLFLGVTDVDAVPAVSNFALRQNYPNPFNPSTNVTFDVPTQSHVRITLHDGLGRMLGNLIDGNYEPGSHTFVFDGANLQSGTYYMTMTAGDLVQTRSMTLVK